MVGDAPFRVVLYTKRREARLCAYLEYLGANEAPAFFALSLVRNGVALETAENNGGALRGGGTEWACGLTFCKSKFSGSKGRAQDWGAAAWPFHEDSLVENDLRVRGSVRVFTSRNDVGCGSVVVPIARSDRGKNILENAWGLREGEEYRVMAVNGGEKFYLSSSDWKNLTVRPAFHNRGDDWPLTIGQEKDLEWLPKENVKTWPKRFMNEALTAAKGDRRRATAAVLAWCLSALAPLPLVFFAKTFLGVYVIPSESMAPALRPGDVLVVENYGLRSDRHLVQRGDIVLFKAPPAFAAILDTDKLKKSTFVKRVAFLPGDQVQVDDHKIKKKEGPPLAFCETLAPQLERAILSAKQEKDHVLDAESLFVLGDCSGVSIDSRVWGDLPSSNLVGKPTFRIWPPQRAGPFLTPK